MYVFVCQFDIVEASVVCDTSLKNQANLPFNQNLIINLNLKSAFIDIGQTTCPWFWSLYNIASQWLDSALLWMVFKSDDFMMKTVLIFPPIIHAKLSTNIKSQKRRIFLI